MADYDEEIPFGVGVSARGVEPDTENPFDTGAVNTGYDETGEMNEMTVFLQVHPDVVQKTQLITELTEKHLLLKE